MILGIGIDIADNSRFSGMPEGLKRKLFTQYELEMSNSRAKKDEFYASRFASKEALSKALGTGFDAMSPLDIEIRIDDLGKPYIFLLKKLGFDCKIHLSISHEREMSVAMVVLEDVSL